MTISLNHTSYTRYRNRFQAFGLLQAHGSYACLVLFLILFLILPSASSSPGKLPDYLSSLLPSDRDYWLLYSRRRHKLLLHSGRRRARFSTFTTRVRAASTAFTHIRQNRGKGQPPPDHPGQAKSLTKKI